MNEKDQDQLQAMLRDLQGLVWQHVTAIDAPAALQWMEDALDEAYSDVPRASLVKIFLAEIRKKAPRSLQIGESIDAIEQLLHSAFAGLAPPR